ncbi:MAG: GNAT family N-acetyltransferase [Candidatus Poribacteria bacterium]|nr:GNAT family N-acetyltransferase [Candidatus Poribacteria bacterium]
MPHDIDLANLELRELTPDCADDFLDYFDGDAFADNPEGTSCYCCYFHWIGTNGEDWSSRTAAANRAWKAELIQRSETTGILAYLNNRPVGWCHAAEKRSLAHLAAMDVLASSDDESVGSIVCFVVTKRFRGTGLSHLLLEAACALLAKRNLRIVEAYPDRQATDSYSNFHGRLDMFLNAGFQIHRELEGDMSGIVIVRRSLTI